MKKMNYVVSLFMAFSAASTAFADQIEELTQQIIESKNAPSLLEFAQQLQLKSSQGPLTRGNFKKLIDETLRERTETEEDLSKPTNDIIEDLKGYIKDKAGINEADELEIMAREDAIRNNKHGKKIIVKDKGSNSEDYVIENPEENQENQEYTSQNESTPSKSSEKRGSDVFNTRKSERIPKPNLKYTENCIGC